jgi:N-acetylglucosamine-6-phosphate deacetylase
MRGMKRKNSEIRRVVAADVRSGATFEFSFDAVRLIERRPVRAKAQAVFGPGFCDLQCNGHAGVDFNREDAGLSDIAAAVRAMWRNGCTFVLPTLITASKERLCGLFARLVATMRTHPEVAESVPGFHLEGPFISPVEGARGAHPLAHVSPVNGKLWRECQRAAGGRIKLLTVAPEVKGAIPFIRQMRKESVLPALGHTLADAATVAQACDAGAMMTTHLGNGCPQMMHRHRNPIFAQLGEDRLAASVIADGVHLPADVLKLFCGVKGPSRTVLVTDAMAAAGAPSGRYTIGDLDIEVGDDRVVRQPGSPNLAGSALTMDRGVAGLVTMAGFTLAEAWAAASTVPWSLLRRAGAVGRPGETCVLARWSGGDLRVLATLRGKRVLWAE